MTTVILIIVGAFETVSKGKETGGGTGDLWKNRDHPSHCSVKISYITWKNPGDLRRLAVTQTPVKNNNLEPI